MKKIMFNDRFGLTEAVLSGNKTQTRRIVKIPTSFNGVEVRGFYKYTKQNGEWYTVLYDEDESPIDGSVLIPHYKVGEVVAIAQSYYNAFGSVETGSKYYHLLKEPIVNGHKGNYNKMFVKADLMPHQIRITGVRIERLQDISEEDCLKEGVRKTMSNQLHRFCLPYDWCGNKYGLYGTKQRAYAALIDRVSGKGTWESNPFVWVYDFELIK